MVNRQFVVKSRAINSVFTLLQLFAGILEDCVIDIAEQCRGSLLSIVASFALVLEKSQQSK